jgi:fructose-1,6-bisphosphatase I
VLYDLALAGKIIASQIRRAGLMDVLGMTGDVNIQGEEVAKLDRIADDTIFRLNDHTGRLAAMGSEEHQEMLHIPEKYPTGKYVLLYDPLDGSSNIDFNVSTGTIFSIYRRLSKSGRGTLEDLLQKGTELVAAGYIIYGSSTMLVYTTGNGVHGFTLNPTVGEFLLSHPNIRMPAEPRFFSVNMGYQKYWSQGINLYTDYLQGKTPDGSALSLRYIGSLIADFHRNLLSGGVFYYPADNKEPGKAEGKLRLMYEAIPMAFIAEQAGGYGSDGRQSILEIEPMALHQRVPLFVGDRNLVEKAEEFIRRFD